MMNQLLQSNWWSLELPDEWHAHEDDDTVVIADDDAISVLEISAIKKAKGCVESNELMEFASELVSCGHKPSEVCCGDFAGLCFKYDDEEGVWREWFLAKQDVALFIVYSCHLDHKTLDDQAIDAILSTLKLSIEQEQQ